MSQPPYKRKTRRVYGPRVNGHIRARKVRVLFEDKQLGIIPTVEAIETAKKVGLDLVEVAANADPPVCRIIDFGKYKYQLSKQKKNREKHHRIKEVKLRPGIDPHDYMVKMTRAEDFLGDGHKLRVQLQFRGREMAHQEIGMELMHKVRTDLEGMSHVDAEPRKAGRNISMMLSPLPADRQKRNFIKKANFVDELIDEDDDDENEDEEVSTDTQPETTAPDSPDE